MANSSETKVIQSKSEEMLSLVFAKLMDTEEAKRIDKYKMFRAFYENDFDEIKERTIGELTDKGIYGDILDKTYFQHDDIIEKTLSRKVAGIFSNEPIVRLIINESISKDGKTIYDVDENLPDILKQCKFTNKIKDSVLRALFVNLVCVIPVPRDNKIELDVMMPDEFIVYSKPNFLDIEEIVMVKWNGADSYFLHITETEYYITDSDGNKSPVSGNESTINPLDKIFVSVLRIKETKDFYGEPNWSLLRNQIAIDVKQTNFDLLEIYQEFGIWVATNCELKDGQGFSPNSIIKAQDIRKDMQPADLKNVVPDIDWEQLRQNIEWRKLTTYKGQGLSSSSISTEEKEESGIAKMLGESEIQEQRNELKSLIYDFVIDVLENLRLVNNLVAGTSSLSNNKKLDESKNSYFDITFSEEKPHESVEDKIKRRDDEVKRNIRSDIDFIMEDLEVDEEEAKRIYQKNKKFKEDNKVATEPNNQFNNTEGNQ